MVQIQLPSQIAIAVVYTLRCISHNVRKVEVISCALLIITYVIVQNRLNSCDFRKGDRAQRNIYFIGIRRLFVIQHFTRMMLKESLIVFKRLTSVGIYEITSGT